MDCLFFQNLFPVTFFPLPFMAITAANKIINDKYVKCDYYLIEKGNLLLHQVITCLTNVQYLIHLDYFS